MERNRIVLICGLPGSGKTFWALMNMAATLDRHVDDPKDIKEIYEAMNITGVRDIFITDPWLCLKENQESAKKNLKNCGRDIEWIFFENNPEQCLINSRLRAKRVDEDIKFFSENYFIPPNSKVIPVYKPKEGERNIW